MTPLLAGFQTRYPQARIRVWINPQKLDLIADGIDIALRVGDLRDSTLIARRLLLYRHVLVASREYLKRAGIPDTPSDLHQHRLIAFCNRYDDIVWHFRRNEKAEKITLVESLSMNDFTGIQLAAEAHQGITEIPAIICADALSRGDLLEVLPEWSFSPFNTPQVALYAVYPSNRHLPQLVRLFKDYCVENIHKIVTQA